MTRAGSIRSSASRSVINPVVRLTGKLFEAIIIVTFVDEVDGDPRTRLSCATGRPRLKDEDVPTAVQHELHALSN